MLQPSRFSARRAALTLALILAVVGPVRGAGQTRKPVTPGDYDRWETLGTAVLSDDGRWMAVPISRVDGTSELRLHRLGADAATWTKPAFVAAEGRDPSFSADSRWLAYRIGHSEPDREKLQAEKKPIHDSAGILALDGDLAAATPRTVRDVARSALSKSGAFLALHKYVPEGSKRKGADLVVCDLAAGADATFGNVSEFAWQDEGTLIALAIDAEGRAGNGVQLYGAASGSLRVLDSGDATFTGLAWREDDDDLAAFRSRADNAHEEDTHVVLAWRDLTQPGRAAPPLVYDHASDPAFPAGSRVASAGRLRWSKDGATLFFGIQPWERKPDTQPGGRKPERDDEPGGPDRAARPQTREDAGSSPARSKVATVDVWHAKDERIIPMQRVQQDRDRDRHYLAAWHLDQRRFVQLGTDLDETVTVLEGDRFAVETDRRPYMFENMFDRPRHDIHLVDVSSGERRKVIDGVWYFQGGSAEGHHLLYFKDDQYWTFDINRDRHARITGGLRATWINTEYDTPVRQQKPPWGVAGWSKDDRAVLIYDQYDIWRVAADGSGGSRLTSGAGDAIRHRYVRLDPDERAIDTTRPIYLSLYGNWTKKYGYARLDFGGRTNGGGEGVERLVWLDKNVSRLGRARKAETFAYVAQDFDDAPDYFAGSAQLADARPVTEINPFQRDFAWGRSALVEYRGAKGERLQGALYYPAGYEAGRQYPMIVYIYERLSQGVHTYVVPSERSSYNTSVFTANGYFVLQPDIVFRPRDPGVSATECVTAAVRKVLESGMVDPKRVGLVGHSWGGYEASFIPTRTRLFAAAVAGAPLTNFFSMFGTVHWNQGMPETEHFETGQARMEVPYWVDMEAYVRNSPVMFVHELQTPMLVFFGDKDGTVDWHQGVELYNYARRAGKLLVMLVYQGENHSAREKPNQIDYSRRVLQWFGHFLKGEEAPAWIARGVTVLERDREVKRTVRPGS